jgi:TPR repeat protein
LKAAPLATAPAELTEIPMSDLQDIDLQSGLSAFESRSFAQALKLLSPFAEAGNADAQHRLAIMFQNGLGCARHDNLALRWMMAAAEQGHAVAQHGLGFMYLEGECTEKNPAEAVKWFTRAAEQGLVGSQTTLALMYEQGNGVEQNLEEANRWYRMAGFEER